MFRGVWLSIAGQALHLPKVAAIALAAGGTPALQSIGCLGAACSLLVAGAVVPARADNTRVQVGTLDGTPIYHWRAFKSSVADDADRALILREFQRKEFRVPSTLVEERIQAEVKGGFGGDQRRFERELREKQATLPDYRRFLREEIILSAMTMQHANPPADRSKVNEPWLATLRARATVKMFPVKLPR